MPTTMMKNKNKIEVLTNGVDEVISEAMLVDGNGIEDVVEIEDFSDEMYCKSDGERQTYPADCYSFIALHSPFDRGGYFYFGFSVWACQVSEINGRNEVGSSFYG